MDDDTYSAPIQAFKKLCMEEGDYTLKKKEDEDKEEGLGDGG